jgi:hypothetical protein
MCRGHAIAQVVSRRLPTPADRVRTQVRSCGICGGQSGTGAGFLRVLRFPLPILIPQTVPHSPCIIRFWYNRPVSGPKHQIDPVSPHPKKIKRNVYNCIFRWPGERGGRAGLSKYISCFRWLRTPGLRQTDRTVRAVPIQDVERGRVLAAGDALPYQINYMPIRKSPTTFTVNRSFALPRYTDRVSGC